MRLDVTGRFQIGAAIGVFEHRLGRLEIAQRMYGEIVPTAQQIDAGQLGPGANRAVISLSSATAVASNRLALPPCACTVWAKSFNRV